MWADWAVKCGPLLGPGPPVGMRQHITWRPRAGALVKVYGVPQTDGTLRAYVLFYTGDMPSG
jgi:hypothetical protein